MRSKGHIGRVCRHRCGKPQLHRSRKHGFGVVGKLRLSRTSTVGNDGVREGAAAQFWGREKKHRNIEKKLHVTDVVGEAVSRCLVAGWTVDMDNA